MLDCRYYDLCCFTDDSCNGEQECPKRNHCQFYSPMPDVKALVELADKIDRKSNDGTVNPDPMRPLATSLDLFGYARRIREALGVDE